MEAQSPHEGGRGGSAGRRHLGLTEKKSAFLKAKTPSLLDFSGGKKVAACLQFVCNKGFFRQETIIYRYEQNDL